MARPTGKHVIGDRLMVALKVEQVDADNVAKATKVAPIQNGTWFQLKTTQVNTSATQRISPLYHVEGTIAADGENTSPVITGNIALGYSVERVGDAAKTTPDAVLGTRTYAPLSVFVDCTGDNFLDLLELEIDHAFPPGVDILIRWWMRSTQLVLDSMCTRSNLADLRRLTSIEVIQ